MGQSSYPSMYWPIMLYTWSAFSFMQSLYNTSTRNTITPNSRIYCCRIGYSLKSCL